MDIAITLPLESGSLPFEDLQNLEIRDLNLGPWTSSTDKDITYSHPAWTKGNYLTGYIKKRRRLHKPNHQPLHCHIFHRLPIEIQLMVLERLHPVDLLHFSQVSKSARSIILHPKAAGVWKVAFEHRPSLPKPPPNLTYASWAFVLFGPAICDECHHFGGLSDFAFQKRYCDSCMEKNYVFREDMRDTDGNVLPYSHVVFSLVPRSYKVYGLGYMGNLGNPRYLRKDLDAMLKKVKLIEILSSQVPHLDELFEEYRAPLSFHITKRNTCAVVADLWALKMLHKCKKDYEYTARENKARCHRRLRALGHHIKDIYSIQDEIEEKIYEQHANKFTPRAFRELRPDLEKRLHTAMTLRVRKERIRLIENLYTAYAKTLEPDKWQYLPPASLLPAIDGIREFILAESSSRGDPDIEYVMTMFPVIESAWTQERQLYVMRAFSDTEATQDLLESECLQNLELATTVVTCADCVYRQHTGRALVGWKNVCCHMVVGDTRCFHFQKNANACVVAASLVLCVGLDPASATVADMDILNCRFLCRNCLKTSTHLRAYTWMECLEHTVEMDIQNNGIHNSHHKPSWFLLSSEYTEFIEEHEREYPLPNLHVWRCNKCAAHYDNQVTQREAMEHMKKVHLVKDPVLDVDVVYDRRNVLRRRRPFRVQLSPAHNFECQLCPDMRIYRLRTLEALLVHLHTKHPGSNVDSTEDWTLPCIVDICE